MDVLFTGFGPFAEVEYNPSWDAAQAAAEALGGSAELLDVTLDVARTLDRSGERRVLVHFGVARRRTEVFFERYAHNWWKDLDDAQPVRLDPNGPTARECELPLDAWARALGWNVSHDAGTYVCNATLYYSLAVAASMFVHIPPAEPAQAREWGVSLAKLLETRLPQIELS